jgi:hypothetical protein
VVGKIMQLIPVFSLFYAGFNPNSELTTDWCWAQPRDVGEACKLYLVGSIRCAVVPTPSLTATRVHDLPLRLRDINIRTEMYWGMHLSWWVGTIYIYRLYNTSYIYIYIHTVHIYMCVVQL